MVVIQSSQWFPVSVVPGTIGSVPPVIVSGVQGPKVGVGVGEGVGVGLAVGVGVGEGAGTFPGAWITAGMGAPVLKKPTRSEEHTSELQSQSKLVCRLLLEKKKKKKKLSSTKRKTKKTNKYY